VARYVADQRRRARIRRNPGAVPRRTPSIGDPA